MYAKTMETIISERGQTAVPAQVRRQFGLKAGQKLQWIEDGKIIYVTPVAADPIKAFRGAVTNKQLNVALLNARKIDG